MNEKIQWNRTYAKDVNNKWYNQTLDPIISYMLLEENKELNIFSGFLSSS